MTVAPKPSALEGNIKTSMAFSKGGNIPPEARKQHGFIEAEFPGLSNDTGVVRFLAVARLAHHDELQGHPRMAVPEHPGGLQELLETLPR